MDTEASEHRKKSGLARRLFKAVGKAGQAAGQAVGKVGQVAGDAAGSIIRTAGQTAKTAGGRAMLTFSRETETTSPATPRELAESLTRTQLVATVLLLTALLEAIEATPMEERTYR